MNVIEKRAKNLVEYRTLSKGKTFKLDSDNCEHVFMVTDGKLSSVNLNTGQEFEFSGDLVVNIVACDLVVWV